MLSIKMSNVRFLIGIVALYFQTGCSTVKKNTLEHTRFVFKQSNIMSVDGENSWKKIFKQSGENIGKLALLKTDSSESVREVISIYKSISARELTVEIKRDTIWRINDEIAMELEADMIVDKKQVAFYLKSKTDQKIYEWFKLAQSKKKFIVQVDKDRKKKILGYSCHYVRVIKLEDTHESMKLGNTIYEMYVTEKIKLPVHSVINIGQYFGNFFPLEIKVWSENLKGVEEVYEIVRIE